MESEFKRVYEGPRWRLRFGGFAGVERTAVIEFQKVLQYYLPYTLIVEPATTGETFEHLALVGTAESNPNIAALIDQGALAAPIGVEFL